MKYSQIFLAALATFATSANVYAESGVVGTGTARVPVYGTLSTQVPEGYVRVSNQTIQDNISAEPLVKVEPVNSKQFDDLRRISNQALLGKVKGYEYMPGNIYREKTPFWLACDLEGKCVKLKAITVKNRKVYGVINNLVNVKGD